MAPPIFQRTRSLGVANPTRPLAGAPESKPLKYVNAASTDVRRTFEKFRRLNAMQAKRTLTETGDAK